MRSFSIPLWFAIAISRGLEAQVSPPIDLGDVTAGGDGTGTAAEDVVGIHPDSGMLETFHQNGPIGIGDAMALQPVDDAVSEFIDSVFIIETAEMPINSLGIIFPFPPEDLLAPPQTWDHILKDRIGGEDFMLSLGGVTFEHGVGIHSAAGITYDLDALRERHGARAVGEVAAYAGMGDSPSCMANPGWVTSYIILSDGEQFLDFASHRTSAGGQWLRLPIPPEARFLTLASGAGNSSFYCNSGAFGDASIHPLPPGANFRRGDADGNGAIELTDAVKLLNYLFLGQPRPECLDAADVDDSGLADISDAIANLNYQFLGGGAPAAPGPERCGPDPSAEAPDLGCDQPCR